MSDEHGGEGLNLVRQLLEGRLKDGSGRPSTTILVVGPPVSGKTSLAFESLLFASGQLGDGKALMTVSNRLDADRLSDSIIRRAKVSGLGRPVTTLPAVAFHILTTIRKSSGLTLPKLLNGAEQDALLRQVLAVHVRHAQNGEPCPVCRLLSRYFAIERWDSLVFRDQNRQEDPASTTESLLVHGINDAFVAQLRDMLARINELGAGRQESEDRIIGSLDQDTPHTERLSLQWRLAFALRRQYAQAINDTYKDEFRLDASRLMVEGAKAVSQAHPDQFPAFLIIDDVQDLTLAGLSFLKAINQRSRPLMLLGNPDESVQAFRGSYPEYLLSRLQEPPFSPRLLSLQSPGLQHTFGDSEFAEPTQASNYRSLLASRISLSIASPEPDPRPLPMRPGKLPAYQGSFPLGRLSQNSDYKKDDSLRTACYRSSHDELEDVIWQIKRAHLDRESQWNDMALIAHDNATVRAFGERLRRDGVPVRYSSVTKPLKDEPFVQGLFALVELARLRRRGLHASSMPLEQISAVVHSRVSSLMDSPLITTASGQPANLASVESSMNALVSLSSLVGTAPVAHGLSPSTRIDASSPLTALVDGWDDLVSFTAARQRERPVQIDDSLLPTHEGGDSRPFDLDALFLLVAFDWRRDETDADDSGNASRVLKAIAAIRGDDAQAKAFAHLWDLVAQVSKALDALPSTEPQYALAAAWDASNVALTWQRQALSNTDEGRAANDRLDVAMRLFDYAASTASSNDLSGFMHQVRSMHVEADSLAKVAPIDQALTLTTPAGAAGKTWPLVWIVWVQEGVWPNLAARNTMFGGEYLAQVMLHGGLPNADEVQLPSDPQLSSLLASEQKSFLVAVTRARNRLVISCVNNDQVTPSDFLFDYLPERFDRMEQAEPSQVTYTDVGSNDAFAGLDTDLRGLVTVARALLAKEPIKTRVEDLSPQGRDAAQALALLTKAGVEIANPRFWPFTRVGDSIATSASEQTMRAFASVPDQQKEELSTLTDVTTNRIALSPSSVDALWACPVCWLLEQRFAGPRPAAVAATFGSLIHQVAQEGSHAGLDMPDFMPNSSHEERLIHAKGTMMDIYRSLRVDPATINDARARYEAIRKDNTAQGIVEFIAEYFLESNEHGYPLHNSPQVTVGTLEQALCERSFNAVLSLGDILETYNALDGIAPIEVPNLYAIMGSLVGGWPEAMTLDLTVRLSGRIDREEIRMQPDGKRQIRLVDYKTGRPRSAKDTFNDLQLVCYQLGLAFPEDRVGNQDLPAMPLVAQSNLFHPAAHRAPGYGFAAEGLYQPPLFVDGHINDSAFNARYYYRNTSHLYDLPLLGNEPPQEVSDQAWKELLGLRSGQAIWALTMISRVFYAAAASRSDTILAHPTHSHLKFCRLKSLCPACGGQSETVFEVRLP